MVKFPDNTESDLRCPRCERKLIVKTNRHTDHQFLGCPNYPECDYTRGIPEEWIMRAQGQPGLFDEVKQQDPTGCCVTCGDVLYDVNTNQCDECRSAYTQEYDTFSDADPGL